MEGANVKDQVFLDCSVTLFRSLPVVLVVAYTFVVLDVLVLGLPPIWTIPGLHVALRLFATSGAVIVMCLPLWWMIRRVFWRPFSHSRIDTNGIAAFESCYPWLHVRCLYASWVPGFGYQLFVHIRSRGLTIGGQRYVPTGPLTPLDLSELSDRLDAFLSENFPLVQVRFPAVARKPSIRTDSPQASVAGSDVPSSSRGNE
jgi:hypothetical protein